ncbi:hypothetical protein P7C70_g4906, partial [Phenoliferia sp. Uapishka_3]
MLLPYTLQSTLGIFDHFRVIAPLFLKYATGPRTSSTRDSWLASLQQGCRLDAAITPSVAGKILSIWTEAVDVLGEGEPPLVFPGDFSSLHPLLLCLLKEGTADSVDENRKVFWDKKGYYRTRAGPGSRAGSEAPGDGEEEEDDGVEDDPEVIEGPDSVSSSAPTPVVLSATPSPTPVAAPVPAAPVVAPSLKRAKARVPIVLPAESAIPDHGYETVDSEEERETERRRVNRKRSAAAAARLNGQPAAPRAKAVDHYDALPVSEDEQDAEDRTLEAARLHRATFFRNVRIASGRGQEEDYSLRGLPRHVKVCKDREIDFSRFTKKGKAGESLADIVAQIPLRIDPKDMGKLLCGEHVPLSDIHSYAPRTATEIPLGLDDLLSPFVEARLEASRVKKRAGVVLDTLAVINAWDLISKLDVQYYPERAEVRHIFRQKLMLALTNVSAEQVQRVIRWVDRTSEEIATVGGKVTYWGQADLNDALYHELVVAPGAAALAVASLQAGRKSQNDRGNGSCNKYNNGVHTPEEERNCTFPHTCRGCGGPHPVRDCNRVGAGGGRGGVGEAARDAAAGAEPWRPLEEFEESGEAYAAGPPGNHLPGIGVAPRLQRSWHWPAPHLDPPQTPLLTSTLTAAPLPRPPPEVLLDPYLAAARLSHPHLFRHESPLKVEAFRLALIDHPNRPWVESLLAGLTDGFWPCHNGVDPPPPSAKLQERYTPRSEEDLLLVEERVKQDVENGWTSPAFSVLPEGFTVSPIFVVRRDDQDPRVVNDHTASGLNDGIDRKDAPAKFDTLPDLIRLLRSKDLETLSDGAVLWKTDVSGAFKQMSMHYAWQYKQAIVVSYLQPDGSRVEKYHIEWRGAFGTRATPFLWTSIMGAVLWIIQSRGDVDNPMAYMDDALGLDDSGILVERTFYGETKWIPPQQAATLDVWWELGIPFKWRKTLHGRNLKMLGIQFDLDEMTATIPPESIVKFAAEARAFLAYEGRNPPLKWWRAIAGYGSYVCTVIPHARLWLTPLYEKLRFKGGTLKNLPDLGVYRNKETDAALVSIVEELERGEPLSLLDPALTEWGESDADLVVYTDACLRAKDNVGTSGLGFWFDYGGKRHHYYSRPPLRYAKIQLAETLTVACAIECVLAANFPGVRRVLIRTDSSAAVFAFDSGAASDTHKLPLRTVVTAAYTSLRRAKVDVRVLHVSGYLNDLADRLSRAPIRDLQFDQSRTPHLSFLHQFDPFPHLTNLLDVEQDAEK